MKYPVIDNYNKKCRVKLFDFMSIKLTIFSFLLLSLWFNQAAAIIKIHEEKPSLFLNERCNPTVRINLIDEKQSGSESHMVFLLQEKYKFLLPESWQWTQLDDESANQITRSMSGNDIKIKVPVNYETTINLTHYKFYSNYLIELIHMITLANDMQSITLDFINSSADSKKTQLYKGVTLLVIEDCGKLAKREDKISYFCKMLGVMEYLGFHNIDFMNDIVNTLGENYVNLMNGEPSFPEQQPVSFSASNFGDKNIHKFFSVVKDVTYFLFTEFCVPETYEKLMDIYNNPVTINIIKHSVYFINAIIPMYEIEKDKLDISNKNEFLENEVEKNNMEVKSLKGKISKLDKNECGIMLQSYNEKVVDIERTILECQKKQYTLNPVMKRLKEECRCNDSELKLLLDCSVMHLTLQLRWEQIMMYASSSARLLIPDTLKTIFPFVDEVRLMVAKNITSKNFFDEDYIASDTSILINIDNDWDSLVPNIDPLECNYTTDMMLGLRQLTLLMVLKSCGASLHFSSHAFKMSDYLAYENKHKSLTRKMICPMLPSINILYGDSSASNEYKIWQGNKGIYYSLYTVPLALPQGYMTYIIPGQSGDWWYNKTKDEGGSVDITLTDISRQVIKSYMLLVKYIFSFDCFRNNFIPLIHDNHSSWINKMSKAPN